MVGQRGRRVIAAPLSIACHSCDRLSRIYIMSGAIYLWMDRLINANIIGRWHYHNWSRITFQSNNSNAFSLAIGESVRTRCMPLPVCACVCVSILWEEWIMAFVDDISDWLLTLWGIVDWPCRAFVRICWRAVPLFARLLRRCDMSVDGTAGIIFVDNCHDCTVFYR